jgi:hypothetical protein
VALTIYVKIHYGSVITFEFLQLYIWTQEGMLSAIENKDALDRNSNDSEFEDADDSHVKILKNYLTLHRIIKSTIGIGNDNSPLRRKWIYQPESLQGQTSVYLKLLAHS